MSKEGESSMAGADLARVVVGVAAVAAASGLAVFAFRAQPAPSGPDADPSAGVMLAAAERGVDLSNGTPTEDRDRLVAIFDSGKTSSFDEVEFRSGLYLAAGTDAVFSGYLAGRYPDGGARLLCCVVDGQLQGPSVELHPDGSTKRSMTHKDGRVVGQIIEFYPGGDLKLRAMAYETTERGGTVVRELLVGEKADGGYDRRSLGSGRLQFIYDNGTVESANEQTPINEVQGWMLFNDTMFGQNAYTSDSRRMDQAD